MKKPKIVNTVIAVEPKITNDICYHLLRDRVLTHRGYHCGKCGKRF